MEDTPANSVDQSVLDTLVKLGGETLVIELIGRFEEVIAERMTPLRAAAARGNLIEVEQIAHALRSSAGTLGAVRLADRLRVLEEDAAAGDGDAMGAELGHVSAELVPALSSLADVAAGLRATLSRRPTR